MSYEDFVQLVRSHLESTGQAKSTFGMEAVGDPGFVNGLLNDGREPRRKTRNKVIEYINAFAPAPEGEAA